MTEDKSMVKSEQPLRLFSSRRQPPLLVPYPDKIAKTPKSYHKQRLVGLVHASLITESDFLPHKAIKSA